MQLRMTLGELGMPSIPSLLPIPRVGSAFDDEGNPTDPKFIEQHSEFFEEFLWYMEALRTQRDAGPLPY
ncbi:MAG: NADPH-dependent FMN reductase, partial [Candidatus Eremiobacteraeota bacterium]|nr:NADPH-dependent FMN reductase [Candidatus Eremiobacteraeota bacterium]